jgi:hypothetical protein
LPLKAGTPQQFVANTAGRKPYLDRVSHQF